MTSNQEVVSSNPSSAIFKDWNTKGEFGKKNVINGQVLGEKKNVFTVTCPKKYLSYQSETFLFSFKTIL